MRLLRAELTRVVGRRGSFWGTIAFAVVIMIIAIVASDPSDGGEGLENVTTAGRYAGLLGVAIMGALAGSYDTANGTMRYLVLTGESRTRLALVRVLGIAVAVLPLAVIVLAFGLAFGATQDVSPTGTDVGNAVWATLSTLWTWGIVSVAIGMLMKSNGPAIAVSLVLFFGGALITGIVSTYIDETLANYLLPQAFAQVSELTGGGDDDFRLALGTAFVVLGVWIVALTVLAVARVKRDEY